MNANAIARMLLEAEDIDPKAYVMAQPVSFVIAWEDRVMRCTRYLLDNDNWSSDKYEARRFATREEAKTTIRSWKNPGDQKVWVEILYA